MTKKSLYDFKKGEYTICYFWYTNWENLLNVPVVFDHTTTLTHNDLLDLFYDSLRESGWLKKYIDESNWIDKHTLLDSMIYFDIAQEIKDYD